MKTKVYIYTRVFTTMQIDGFSLEAQKIRIQASYHQKGDENYFGQSKSS